VRPCLRTISSALSVTALSVGLLAGVPPATAADGPVPHASPEHADHRPPTTRQKKVRLKVRTVTRGLQHAWDVQQAPGGRLLVTERDRARIGVVRKGTRRRLANLSKMVWVSGETGLMSMAVDRQRRILWACHGYVGSGGPELRVTRWQVDARWRRISSPRAVVTGIDASSGRHGGCRLLLDRDSDALYVGTGDAATSGNPRNLDSLAGKVLRVHRMTGAAMPGNPFAVAGGRRALVWTYGHRNVQGLAQRADGSVWSVEHGSYRDDEVNRLVPGGDYGWDPGPGYDESVPMTDQSLPGKQVEAAWSSGQPTLATSGAAWVRGKGWGPLAGTLAVAALKASRVLFIRFDADGRLKWVRAPAALRRLGRIRSVTSTPSGALLLTTDNGERDRVVRVTPR
jgi:glucose/arabinose dehydrogenase